MTIRIDSPWLHRREDGWYDRNGDCWADHECLRQWWDVDEDHVLRFVMQDHKHKRAFYFLRVGNRLVYKQRTVYMTDTMREWIENAPPIGDTFWIGLVVTLVALVLIAVGLRDIPLRQLDEPEEADSQVPPPAVA